LTKKLRQTEFNITLLQCTSVAGCH